MVSTSGFMIGVIGGILDFASATSLLVSRTTQETTMPGTAPSLVLIFGLYVLGTIVIISAVFSVMSLGFRFPRLFSTLMMAYGAVMIASGWAMITGNMLGTTDLLLYGYGMVVLGVLMLISGASMMRGSMVA